MADHTVKRLRLVNGATATTLLPGEAGLDQQVRFDNLIIETLTAATAPVKTLVLAKLLGPSASCKMVNPTLYRLQKEGRIVRHANENGTDPHWSISTVAGNRGRIRDSATVPIVGIAPQ